MNLQAKCEEIGCDNPVSLSTVYSSEEALMLRLLKKDALCQHCLDRRFDWLHSLDSIIDPASELDTFSSLFKHLREGIASIFR
jgi:hypothetical protein